MTASNYVAMTPKDEPERGIQQIFMRIPNRCEHVETVCVECVDQWETDYTIHYRRTIKGRELLGLISQKG